MEVFPPDSSESKYLARITQQTVQALEKSGAPRLSPTASAPATGPKKDWAALVAAEKEKWGLA